jgi:hypothetical protein
MILSTSSYLTMGPFHRNYSTEIKSTAREVSTHISLLGSISETRKSDLQNCVVLNTRTVAYKYDTGYRLYSRVWSVNQIVIQKKDLFEVLTMSFSSNFIFSGFESDPFVLPGLVYKYRLCYVIPRTRLLLGTRR